MTEITARARQMTTAESQQIARRDHEANTALVEAHAQPCGLVAAMRNDFNEASVEFTKQKRMPKHHKSREVSNQHLSQEVHGQNERIEMRINMMTHEYQSAMEMAKTEFDTQNKSQCIAK